MPNLLYDKMCFANMGNVHIEGIEQKTQTDNQTKKKEQDALNLSCNH